MYTRSVVKDASDWALSRDPAEFSRRRQDKERRKDIVPKNPLRFPWHEVFMHYPQVKDEFETVSMLREGYSIARFGDGEMKLITGGAQIREPANKNLGLELKRVLNYPHEKCVVGIPTMNPKGAKYKNWVKHAGRFSKLLSSKVQYYSAFISRPDSAQWIATPEYARSLVEVWEDKRVAFVCERESKFYTLMERTCLNESLHVPCPHMQTYQVAEKIITFEFPHFVSPHSCYPAAHKLFRRYADYAGLNV